MGSARALVLLGSALQLAGSGVSVVTIFPGYIDTPMTRVNKYRMPFIISASDAAPCAMSEAEAAKRAFRSLVPSIIVIRSMGLWDSRQARKYALPFLWAPSMGSSLTVVLPPRPSSITQYPSPSARRNT